MDDDASDVTRSDTDSTEPIRPGFCRSDVKSKCAKDSADEEESVCDLPSTGNSEAIWAGCRDDEAKSE